MVVASLVPSASVLLAVYIHNFGNTLHTFDAKRVALLTNLTACAHNVLILTHTELLLCV